MSSIQTNNNLSSSQRVSGFFSRNKTILIVVSIILILIIVIFAVLKINIGNIPGTVSKFFKGESNNVFDVNDKEVFNVKSNMFNFEEAKLVCKAYGAEMATLEQLVEAHKNGANWCNYGWTQEQLALYPIQESTVKKLKKEGKEGYCGVAGLNGGYFANPYIKFGANCYGIKPDPSQSDRFKYNLETKLTSTMDEKQIQLFKDKLSELQVSPFNGDKWSTN